MLFPEQCKLARVMTQTDTSDNDIIKEYITMPDNYKEIAAKTIHSLVKLHNQPFDKAFPIVLQDFAHIASEYMISPVTLFCVYMERKVELDKNN